MDDLGAVDPKSRNVTLLSPGWSDIERAIKRLDGDVRSTVIIGQLNPELDFMGIGGGEDALIDPVRPTNVLVPVFMGQTTNVPRRELTKLSTALVAAKTYAERGDLDERFEWLAK